MLIIYILYRWSRWGPEEGAEGDDGGGQGEGDGAA